MPSQRPSDQLYDLEKFFNYAVDMLCIADTRGYFRRVNPSFTRVLGYTAEELVATPFLEFVHPDDREQTIAEVTKLSTGEMTLQFENRYRCKDGTYKYLAWTSFPERQTGLLYAVARDVTEQHLRADQVDGITGVPNRRAWDEALAAEWKRARRLEVPLALALLDVDHLRSYNDACGHLDGDKCLRRIATAINEHLRRTGDLVARYYGGTFGILLAGGLTIDQAGALCETLRGAVERLDLKPRDGASAATLTISAGVAVTVPEAKSAPDTLVTMAQDALKAAKKQGRNRVVKGTAA